MATKKIKRATRQNAALAKILDDMDRVRAIVNARGVTFTRFKDRRSIDTRDPLTDEEYQTIADAMRRGLV